MFFVKENKLKTNTLISQKDLLFLFWGDQSIMCTWHLSVCIGKRNKAKTTFHVPLPLLDTVLQNDYAFRFVKPDQFTRDFKCSFSPVLPSNSCDSELSPPGNMRAEITVSLADGHPVSPSRKPHTNSTHIKARYHNLILISLWCIPVQPLVLVEGACSWSMIYLCLLFVSSIDLLHSALTLGCLSVSWEPIQHGVILFRTGGCKEFLQAGKLN